MELEGEVGLILRRYGVVRMGGTVGFSAGRVQLCRVERKDGSVLGEVVLKGCRLVVVLPLLWH